MTKRNIERCFRVAVGLYILALLAGVALRIYDKTMNTVIYSTFKDMIPLIIAMPAAWLAYCVQRRFSYLQQLRTLWSCLVEAVGCATHHTYLDAPTPDQHLDALRKLSVSIDEVRGVFTNLEEQKDKIGLYPFEPIKNIYFLLQELRPDKVHSVKDREQIRDKMFVLWREARQELLKEFDREVPSFSHSHWLDPEKSRVYKQHGIEKKVT